MVESVNLPDLDCPSIKVDLDPTSAYKAARPISTREAGDFFRRWREYQVRLEAIYRVLAEEAWWNNDQCFPRDVSLHNLQVEGHRSQVDHVFLRGNAGGEWEELTTFVVPLDVVLDSWEEWYPDQMQRALDAEESWWKRQERNKEYAEYLRLKEKYEGSD